MMKPQPIVKKYYDGLEEGKILGLKCTKCGYFVWPPKPACEKDGCFDMEWAEYTGDFIIDDFSINSAIATRPEFKKFMPYYIAFGHLENGSEFCSMLLGVKDDEHRDALYAKLPFRAKPVIVEHEHGFKIVAAQAPEV